MESKSFFFVAQMMISYFKALSIHIRTPNLNCNAFSGEKRARTVQTFDHHDLVIMDFIFVLYIMILLISHPHHDDLCRHHQHHDHDHDHH